VPVDGAGGETVGDDKHRVDASIGCEPPLERFARSRVKTAPQVGTLEITIAMARPFGQLRAGCTANGQPIHARRPECTTGGLDVERLVHGVASAGVRELEIQVRFGGKTGPGAAERNARGGECAQLAPGIGRHQSGSGLL
jgi:hypothetical protein